MIKKYVIIALALTVGAISNFAQTLDSLSYAAGMLIGDQVRQQVLPNMNGSLEGSGKTIAVETFISGLQAALRQDASVMKAEAAADYFQQQVNAAEKAYRERNEQWLNANKNLPGVQVTASGLQYKILKEGTGARPTATDKVTVRYQGCFIDGTEFDSSYKRTPDTTTFPVNGVIKGWTEALQLMPVGSVWELYIPQQLGYGTRATGPIKPYSTLIFKVELVEIAK